MNDKPVSPIRTPTRGMASDIDDFSGVHGRMHPQDQRPTLQDLQNLKFQYEQYIAQMQNDVQIAILEVREKTVTGSQLISVLEAFDEHLTPSQRLGLQEAISAYAPWYFATTEDQPAQAAEEDDTTSGGNGAVVGEGEEDLNLVDDSDDLTPMGGTDIADLLGGDIEEDDLAQAFG